MLHLDDYRMLFWLALASASIAVIARGFWLYRASLTWPTADGAITCVNIERKRDVSGGWYIRATFNYDFLDPDGRRLSGSWYKNFSNEPEARDFAARELPIGKSVIVRFNPKDFAVSALELDSWTYTNDRPTSLNI
jgi:hypothetical protein